MTKTGNLRVRDIGSDRVSMLKALDEAAKGQDRNRGSGDDETGKGGNGFHGKTRVFFW